MWGTKKNNERKGGKQRRRGRFLLPRLTLHFTRLLEAAVIFQTLTLKFCALSMLFFFCFLIQQRRHHSKWHLKKVSRRFKMQPLSSLPHSPPGPNSKPNLQHKRPAIHPALNGTARRSFPRANRRLNTTKMDWKSPVSLLRSVTHTPFCSEPGRHLHNASISTGH